MLFSFLGKVVWDSFITEISQGMKKSWQMLHIRSQKALKRYIVENESKSNQIQVIFTLLAGFWPEGGKMIKVLPANFNENFADTLGPLPFFSANLCLDLGICWMDFYMEIGIYKNRVSNT